MLAELGLTRIIGDFVTPERISLVVRVLLVLGIGIPLLILVRKLTRKIVTGKLSVQSEQLIQRAVYYIGLLIILVSVLNEFGFKLSALLGAAGVFGIAIGFASQTSISNIISGIFLISEKPFMIGDTVQIGSTIGVINSIDLLSIKLKTLDNRFVRVPNETMIKTEVINNTKFNQRRVNVSLGVAYKEDLRRVMAILDEIAVSEPLALRDPPHVILLDEFGDSGIKLTFGVWCETASFWDLKNALMLSIKERFDHDNIEIPYPHMRLMASQAGDYQTTNLNAKEGTNGYET
ncbi:MAG TPA: mechanosensitive ion channel family protein [Candidatus Cloacimonadota bacterium]|nr:mechanosensitive ion channel family protein [Candidatus Cloacimonadota bacterium]